MASRREAPLTTLYLAFLLFTVASCESASSSAPAARASVAPESSAQVPASAPTMNEARYLRIQRRLFEELAKDIEAAKKRRYCSSEEIVVAEHALTPSGFRRMQPILDETGVTGTEVAAWVSAHPDVAMKASDDGEKHDARLAAFRREMGATLPSDANAPCDGSGPRCETAFLRFLAFTLHDAPSEAVASKRKELHRAIGGFLGACEGGRMAEDFACVLEAQSPDDFESCTFHRGLPLGWFRPG